jgi:hypothetical protein
MSLLVERGAHVDPDSCRGAVDLGLGQWARERRGVDTMSRGCLGDITIAIMMS